MFQILHVFRKDGRRLWPEVSASLVLLILYGWREVRLQHSGMRAYMDSPLMIWLQFVTVLLPLAWFLLIVRVVQEESLVGDRQWWVTKPYRWPALLIAKIFFLLASIIFPLLLAQMFLIRSAGFAVSPYLAGLLRNLSGLPGLLIVVCFILAALTRTLAHAIVAVIVAFLLMIGASSLGDFAPDRGLENLQGLSQAIRGAVLAAAAVAVILLQYARRKTVGSRSLVAGAAAVTLVIGWATPYRVLMERKYPVISARERLLELRLREVPPPEQAKAGNPREEKSVTLRLPVQISGLAQDAFITVDAERWTVEDSSGARWPEEWGPSGRQWWPEDRESWMFFSLKTPTFEKLKDQRVRLHLEMAISEYQLTAARLMIVPDGDTRIAGLGICGLREMFRTSLTCRNPLKQPVFIATFDATSARCPDANAPVGDSSRLMRYANSGSYSGAPDLVNPISTYSIYFWKNDYSFGKPPEPRKICPGDSITLSTPMLKRHARMEVVFDSLELHNIRFMNPASDHLGGEGGMVIGLRAY